MVLKCAVPLEEPTFWVAKTGTTSSGLTTHLAEGPSSFRGDIITVPIWWLHRESVCVISRCLTEVFVESENVRGEKEKMMARQL